MECPDESNVKPSKASEVSLSKTLEVQEEFPYSYHTFMFPFLWKCSDTDINAAGKKCKSEKSNSEKLFAFLDNESYWEPYESPLFDNEKDCNNLQSKEQARLDYSMYQYFNVPARKAIFGNIDNNGTYTGKKVHNYIYKFKEDSKEIEVKAKDKKEGEKGEDNKQIIHNIYSIIVKKVIEIKNEEKIAIDNNSVEKDKSTDEKKEKAYKVEYIKYDLGIKRITLRLYDPIGIGVIVYELENYNHRCIEDVIQINEYGRRIQLAMMAPDAEGTKFLTAARLCIQGTYLCSKINQNFEDEVLAHSNSAENFPWDKDKLNAVSLTVSELFSDRGGKHKVSFEKKEEGKFYFMPYVDDRMFCMSLISDHEIYPHLKYIDIDSLGDEEQLKRLYEYVFIDSYNGCTCQNLPMCKEMLKKALYLRWADCGSIFGINRYSMVAITGKHNVVGDTVIQPFLTIYKEMVQLVLVQRAAIGMFAERAMEISRIASENKLIKNYMMELQQDYVSFKNQILLFEVTAQQQGIELYDMIRDTMNIEKQKTELEEQFHILVEISEMQSNDSTNAVLHIFTVFGLLFVGLQIVQQQFGGNSSLAMLLLTIFSAMFIAFIWCMRKHLKSPHKIEGNSKMEKSMLFFTSICIAALVITSFIDFDLFIDHLQKWISTLF